MITRGTLAGVADGGKLQGVSFRGRDGDDDAERFQNYGFTSAPHAGAEVVVVNVGGDGSHPIVIAIDDRRYRINGLAGGEVCVYDDLGQRITLYRDRVEIEAPRVVVNSPAVYLGGPGPAGPLDGFVHGSGIDTLTGTAYALLGSASVKVAGAKL
jgi:phage baseplate assembly protein V